MFVPEFSKTPIKIAAKNKNGSIYDSHIIIKITSAHKTASIIIHSLSTGAFLSDTSPLVYIS